MGYDLFSLLIDVHPALPQSSLYMVPMWPPIQTSFQQCNCTVGLQTILWALTYNHESASSLDEVQVIKLASAKPLFSRTTEVHSFLLGLKKSER